MRTLLFEKSPAQSFIFLAKRAFVVVMVFGVVCGAGARSAQRNVNCTVIETDHYFDGVVDHRGSKFWIVIKGDQIDSIHEKQAPPSDVKSCTRLSLTGLTLTPGLIDLHTHLLIDDRSYSKNFSKELMRIVKEKPESRLKRAKEHSRSLLLAGFTSVRDLGNSGRFLDQRLREELAATMERGPRIFFSGPGLAVAEGQFPLGTSADVVAQEYELLKNVEGAASVIAQFKKKGVDLIKVYADNDPNSSGMSEEMLSAVVRAAHGSGLKVAAHATRATSARNAVRAGADTVEHGYELDADTIKLMKDRGTILVANDFNGEACEIISTNNPDPLYRSCLEYRHRHSARLLAAHRGGVKIGFGSDMYIDLKGSLADRGMATMACLLAYAEEGLTPLETLRSATSNAALALGHPELGHIRVGVKADMAAFAGDLMQDPNSLNQPRFVMKAGKIVRRP
jgi:imidazolonepropionase-like amidohydrolase